jgi:hypothetical protein
VFVAWVALGVLLLVNVPLLVCMPLWPDVSLYDVCARNLLDGGVPYRDAFDNNLPGIVWLHALIRWLLGWSSEAIRLVDLLIVAAIVYLLVRWLRLLGRSRAAQVWTAVVLFGFYFSTSEFNHCQRDTWMLLPALVALDLRRRQVARLAGRVTDPRPALRWGLVEGLCWGAALWIKPHVILPALLCWGASAMLIGRGSDRGGKLVTDAVGLLAGGILAGTLGIAWLLGTGAWADFTDVFVGWNREYFPGRVPLARRALDCFTLLRPWGLVQLAAVPLAVFLLDRAWPGPARAGASERPAAPGPQTLLAGLYLGWLLQVIFWQHGYEYVHVPLVLLGLTLVAAWDWSAWHVRKIALAAFVGWAALVHPMFQLQRSRCWFLCWTEGSSPQVRDRLTLAGLADWTALDRVETFLRDQHLGPRELTCYDWKIPCVYVDLGVKPSTRFVFLNSALVWFPRHREVIRKTVADSPGHFVVSDLTDAGLSPGQAAEGSPTALPPAFPEKAKDVFPWSEPIIFRSGRYAVHQVKGPVKRLWPLLP